MMISSNSHGSDNCIDDNNIIKNNKKVRLDDMKLKRRKKMLGLGLGKVVIGVDSERKSSQNALKWAVDRLLNTSSFSNYELTLLHIRHSAPLVPFNYSYHASKMVIEREADDQELEMLRSFRGFCARKQVRYEIVVVEDDDVAQALVDYVIRHRVENLLLGAPSRNGFSRLFNHGCGIASTVLKWIPNFCNLYVISKLGKPSCVRNASTPLHNHPNPNPNHKITLSRRRGHTMSELDTLMVSEGDMECSFPSPATSIDGVVLYEQVGDETIELNTSMSSSNAFKRASKLLLTHKLESMEEDMKRLQFGAKEKEEQVLQTSLSLTSKLN